MAHLHVSTHMATEHDNNHAAATVRSATADPKTPHNYAHTNAVKAAGGHRYIAAKKSLYCQLQPVYPKKCGVSRSGFLPTASPRQHSVAIPLRFTVPPFHPKSPLLISQSHHFPKSPLPQATASLSHHSPKSPLPSVTTSLSHHFPKSSFP